jgi:hypothetical protein
MMAAAVMCPRWKGLDYKRIRQRKIAGVDSVDRYFCLKCMRIGSYSIGSRRIFDRHHPCAPTGSPLLSSGMTRRKRPTSGSPSADRHDIRLFYS